MSRLVRAPLLLVLAAASPSLSSRPVIGLDKGRCRPNEAGPAIIVDVVGLRDRIGTLRAELYPNNKDDFLADDHLLLSKGKTFRRAELRLDQPGPARICIRAPAPGVYSLALIHDRDDEPGFNILHDGIGFPGNPKMGLHRPHIEGARIVATTGIVRSRVILNYRRGLFSFGPLGPSR